MRIRDQQLSSSDWEELIGERFRALRLAAELDQSQLAASAAVSVGALRNLERGSGSTLKTLVQVTRALGREDWFDGIAPHASISPLEAVRSGRVTRSRVYRQRGGKS
jgi:transcriptional regulator with XRE-family HTH domain